MPHAAERNNSIVSMKLDARLCSANNLDKSRTVLLRGSILLLYMYIFSLSRELIIIIDIIRKLFANPSRIRWCSNNTHWMGPAIHWSPPFHQLTCFSNVSQWNKWAPSSSDDETWLAVDGDGNSNHNNFKTCMNFVVRHLINVHCYVYAKCALRLAE